MNMSQPKHALVFFEVPVHNFERAVDFYNTILGITLEIIEKQSPYRRFAMFPSTDDGVGGAIAEIPDFKPSVNGSRIYLHAGKNINIVANRIEQAGGTLIQAKTKLQEHCYYALFLDTEGNQIGIYSPQ